MFNYSYKTAHNTARRTGYSALEFDNRTDFERMSDWWHKVARPWIEHQKRCAEFSWLFSPANVVLYTLLALELAVIALFVILGFGASTISLLHGVGSKLDSFIVSYSMEQRFDVYLRLMILGAGAGVIISLGDRKVRLELLAASAVEYLWEVLKEWVTAPLK